MISTDLSNRIFSSSIPSGDRWVSKVILPDNLNASVREAASKISCHMRQQCGYFESIISPFLMESRFFGVDSTDPEFIEIDNSFLDVLRAGFMGLPSADFTVVDKNSDTYDCKATTLVALGKSFRIYMLDDFGVFTTDLVQSFEATAFMNYLPVDGIADSSMVFIKRVNDKILIRTSILSDFDYELTPIEAIITDLTESDAINDVIEQSSTILASYSGTVESKISMMQQLGDSKFKSVADISKSIISGLAASGLSGGLSMLTSILTSGSSLTTQDNKIVFTDNRSLCPNAFGSGILTTLQNSLSAVAQAISTIITGLVGGVLGVLRSALNIPSELTEWAQTSEYSSVNNSEKVKGDMTPYGMMRGTIYRNSVVTHLEVLSPIFDLLDSGIPIVAISTIFGTYIIWPYTLDSDGVVTTIQYEFHPGLNDNRQNARLMVSQAIVRGLISHDSWSDEELAALNYTGYRYRDWYFNYNNPLNDDYYTAMLSIITQPAQLTLANDTSGQYINRVYSQDSLIQEVIASNITCAFILMLSCGIILAGGGSTRQSIGIEYTWLKVSGNDAIPTLLNVCTSDFRVWDYSVMLNVIMPFLPNSAITLSKLVNGGWVVSSYSIDHSALSYYTNCRDNSMTYPTTANWLSFPNCLSTIQGYRGMTSLVWLSKPLEGNFSIQMGSYWFLESDTEWIIDVPSFTRGSVSKVVNKVLLISALAATAIVACTLVVRRFVLNKRAFNAARAENAWSAYTANPTAENYKQYRKIARSNNRWAKIIGGTKYDVTSYWGGDSSAPSGELITENFSSLIDSTNNDSLGVNQETLQLIVDYIIGHSN